MYDGIAGIPAATGGTAVNVELGSVLTTLIKVSLRNQINSLLDGIAGVVNGLGV